MTAPTDRVSQPHTADSIRTAREDLIAALAGVVLVGEDEQRVLDWLLKWDQPTLHVLAEIIRRARDLGPAS